MLNSVLWILSLAHIETLPLIYFPSLHYILWLLPTAERIKPQTKQYSWVPRAHLNYDLFMNFFSKKEVFLKQTSYLWNMSRFWKFKKYWSVRLPRFIIILVLLKHYKITKKITESECLERAHEDHRSPTPGSVQESPRVAPSTWQYWPNISWTLSAWSCDHFPGEPVSVPNYPLFFWSTSFVI